MKITLKDVGAGFLVYAGVVLMLTSMVHFFNTVEPAVGVPTSYIRCATEHS